MTGGPAASGAGLDAHVVLERGPLAVDVRLVAAPGEVVGVLGPNGSGKTSVVLALSGLLPLHAGHVALGAETWEGATGRRRAAEDRRVGLMLADPLLFPRMSARDNVAYGPRSRGARRADARHRADDELARVGLVPHAHRRPHELSSGQAARVALARALATDPALLLLDEPLATLDPDTRARTRADLARRLEAYTGVTVLVTHDPLDALTLADRLVFVEEGRVVQEGTPAQVLHEPRSAYVATVVGLNLYAGTSDDDGTVRLDDSAVVVTASARPGPVWATIPPAAVSLHRRPPEGSPRNHWRLTVTEVTVQGQSARVALGGTLPLTAEVTLAAVAELGLRVGEEVWAAVKATEVRTYPR